MPVNKFISVVAALMAAGTAFAFKTWYGGEGVYRIDTGFDAGTNTSGYWWHYTDAADGGASTVTWPVALRRIENNGYAFDPLIDYCGGICGEFHLNKAMLDYNPFVGVGFNIAGLDESGVAVPADVSSMKGICIAYYADISVRLKMGLGDVLDKALDYDVPSAYLPKAAFGTVKNLLWSQFEQEGWGPRVITGDAAANALVQLKFEIQAATGATGYFNIMSIGAYDGGCSLTPRLPSSSSFAKPTSSSSQRSTIVANTVLKGVSVTIVNKNLQISGAIVDVDMFDLQGRLLKTLRNVQGSVNFSTMPSGNYIIRVSSGTQNFTRHVSLK